MRLTHTTDLDQLNLLSGTTDEVLARYYEARETTQREAREMPTFKVFVSSTYIDLKDHRRAVIDSLLRLKLQPVAMEFFGAEPTEPKQVCDSEIRDCDLFIGIYAHRYGFASEEGDKSITEQEFDLARELGKPCFCYLIDEEHPWPPKFIEDEPGKSRLRAFKARIESALVRDTFATPQDLAGRVSSNLGKWLVEHGTSIPSTPKVYHNLPQPDYGTFIGREAELAQVHRTLRPYPHSQEHLVTIDGIGGIGKSALALETAHRYLREYEALPEEERFGAIIWTSAKSSVLTADGIAPRQQITRTLDDIYTTISVALEREDITRARPEEQDELVRRALIQQRTLLIIDNLETIDDERVNAFLRELPAPTKAIVTTRHRIDVAYPVRLTGMPKEDGLALIAQECAKKGVALTQAEAEKLYDRTGGVPLAMVWSVAQMGFGHPVEAVLRRLGQPSEDIARYCFEGTMERIRGKPAHKLLMALSLFATDASREALGYVADLPELDQDEGLVALEKLSLLNRQAGRFSLLPLTRSYLAHELERTPQFAQSAFEGMLTYYKQLVTPPPEARVGILYWDGLANYARTESLQQESGNLIHVIRQALDQRRYAAALDLFLPIVHFLQFWGLWDERLHLGHEMCQAAHELGDPAEVWLWIDNIGWIFRQRQQFSECIQALKRGKLLARQFELDEASILADVFEARLYAEMGDIGLALKKIEPALEQLDLDSVLERSTPMIRRIVARRAVGVAAGLSELQQDFVREKEWYELELELRRSISENPAPSLWSLARVSLKLDDVASAEKFLGQALATAGQKDIAWINYYLAVVAEKRGEWQEARRLGTLALEQFTRLGHKSGVQDCQELLARLQE